MSPDPNGDDESKPSPPSKPGYPRARARALLSQLAAQLDALASYKLTSKALHRMADHHQSKTAMPDDKSKGGGSDRERIDVTQDDELRDWAKSLNTSPDRIKEAVQAVGDRVDKVREYLKSDKPR